MLTRMRHRGPDDRGEVDLPGAWLGHTRLSIVDVSGGHQPLGGAGERWLVGNGEIYNHEAVRRSLPGGRPFRTASDNEVALALIEERGADALGDLEGMYALLSARPDGGGFVAARDPVGIKPLYWTPPGEGGEVRFASELAAFDAPWRVDVEAFPPGHQWTPEGGLKRFAAAVPETPQSEDPAPRARGGGPAGHARGPHRVSLTPDDGRRTRRRVPLRRP